MISMRQVLERSVERFGSNIAFTLKLAEGEYRDITYIRYFEEIRCLGEAMIAEGIGGATIGIIGKNSYAWFLAHLANQFSGGISVMLDKDSPYEEFISNLQRTDTTVIFYDVKERSMVLRAMESGETKLVRAIPLYACEGETDIFWPAYQTGDAEALLRVTADRRLLCEAALGLENRTWTERDALVGERIPMGPPAERIALWSAVCALALVIISIFYAPQRKKLKNLFG